MASLLPLLALSIEALLLSPISRSTRLAHSVPLDAQIGIEFSDHGRLIAALVSGLQLMLYGVPSFLSLDAPERLMTEARVAREYLSLLWFPYPYTADCSTMR
jgi:hypothetical protein